MKRAPPVLVLLVLAVGGGLFLTRPVPCPWCMGGWNVAISDGYAPVNPGCPHCEDEGTVTRGRRLLRRLPHPDVKAMILGGWMGGEGAQENFEAGLRGLIERSGAKIDVGEDPSGVIVYLHDGVDVLLGIEVEVSDDEKTDRVVVILCDEGGALLDHLGVSWAKASSPVFVSHQWSGGGRETRKLSFSRSGITNPTTPVFLVERGAERTTVPAARWEIRARRGRLEVAP